MKPKKKLHILFSVRADLQTKLGGDTQHINYLQKLLKAAGHLVDLAYNHYEYKVSNYDIVHFFNLSIIDHNYTIFLQAKKDNVKTCFTSIFQNPKLYDPYAPYSIFIPKFILEKSKTLLSLSKPSFKTFFKSHYGLRQEFLNQCDQVFCNSTQEVKDIESYYSLSIQNKSTLVIPSIELGKLEDVGDEFVNKFNHKNYLIVVGRIEKLKNQVRILKALSDTDITLVFIGVPNYNNKSFYNSFKQLISYNKRAFYYPELPRKLVLSAIKNAQLVVQASCVENFGFVSLEAHYFQTNLLISENSYFNSAMKINYSQVNPYSIEAIKSTILESLANKKDTKAEHFSELLKIENAFLANTLSSYLKILS
ncbi:MAG: glycosyltransferase [Candidatus Cloacimonetes bacterium]|nr:glycosyltransferase [Candidatus Cloacimonadota bacterium]